MAIALDVERFRLFEPDFVDTPDAVVEVEIQRALLTTDSYSSLPNDDLRELALIYHVCHALTLRTAGLKGAGSLAVKQLSSQNDSITWAVGEKQSGFNLEGSPCGQKLMDLLRSHIPPIFICHCGF